MQFFRALKPIKVISFDLDDTLYGNNQIIKLAEARGLDYLRSHYSALSSITNCDVAAVRNQTLLKQPHLADDVTLLRKAWTESLFEHYGIAYCDDDVNAVFNAFMRTRNTVFLSSAVKAVLSRLKEHVTLVAISNGNVDPVSLELNHYFEHVFFANCQQKMKPSLDMFLTALVSCNIEPEQMLHVGDNLQADILGAHRAGVQSCYYNPYGSRENLPILPCMAITSLAQLLALKLS